MEPRLYRQTDDRRTGDSIIANVNVSSRSLKTISQWYVSN